MCFNCKIVASVAVLLALSGCPAAMSSCEPEAFGRAKTFVIVTIAASPEINVDGAGSAGGGFTLSGLFKSASSDSGYSNKADKILVDTLFGIVGEIGKGRYFRLTQSGWVQQHKAYRVVAGDDHKKFMVSFLVPKGYKFSISRKSRPVSPRA